jgi:hypothetical protein
VNHLLTVAAACGLLYGKLVTERETGKQQNPEKIVKIVV